MQENSVLEQQYRIRMQGNATLYASLAHIWLTDKKGDWKKFINDLWFYKAPNHGNKVTFKALISGINSYKDTLGQRKKFSGASITPEYKSIRGPLQFHVNI